MHYFGLGSDPWILLPCSPEVRLFLGPALQFALGILLLGTGAELNSRLPGSSAILTVNLTH
jgi:hypothetical protein